MHHSHTHHQDECQRGTLADVGAHPEESATYAAPAGASHLTVEPVEQRLYGGFE